MLKEQETFQPHMSTFGLRLEGFAAPAAAFEGGGTQTVRQALKASIRAHGRCEQLSGGNGHGDNELVRPRAKKRIACPSPLNFFFLKESRVVCQLLLQSSASLPQSQNESTVTKIYQ